MLLGNYFHFRDNSRNGAYPAYTNFFLQRTREEQYIWWKQIRQLHPKLASQVFEILGQARICVRNKWVISKCKG